MRAEDHRPFPTRLLNALAGYWATSRPHSLVRPRKRGLWRRLIDATAGEWIHGWESDEFTYTAPSGGTPTGPSPAMKTTHYSAPASRTFVSALRASTRGLPTLGRNGCTTSKGRLSEIVTRRCRLLPWVADALAWALGAQRGRLRPVRVRRDGAPRARPRDRDRPRRPAAHRARPPAVPVPGPVRLRHVRRGPRPVRGRHRYRWRPDRHRPGRCPSSWPRSAPPLLGGPCALVLMLGVRMLRRLQAPADAAPGRPHGHPGAALRGRRGGRADCCGSMLRDPQCRYLPVGLLDDDPAQRHLRIDGVRVLGGRDDIPAAVARTGAATVIFSVANADAAADPRGPTAGAGGRHRVQGPARRSASCSTATVGVGDVRDVQIGDLLGRRQIETDLELDRRVPHRQAGPGHRRRRLDRLRAVPADLDSFDPAELMMLDRDESALHAVQLSLAAGPCSTAPT